MQTPRVAVEIEYAPQENKITSVDFGNTYNNISGVKDSTYPNTLSTISDGARPFILGKSVLGSGDTYMSEYDGYISNLTSNSTFYDNSDATKGYSIGSQNEGLRITISRSDGNPITRLSFFFDKISGEYPIVIKVGKQTYTNLSYNFNWSDSGSTATSIVVIFLSWNKPNSLIRVTGLVDGITIKYDRTSGLRSLNLNIQSTISDTAEYGCIAQENSLSLYDDNYQIYYYSSYGFLKAGLPVRVYIAGQKVAEYKSGADWNVSQKNVSVSLYDEIENWSNIQVSVNSQMLGSNLLDFIYNIFENAGVQREVIGYKSDVGEYLSTITVKTLALPNNDNLRSILDKICLLAQCNIYVGLDSGDGKRIYISRL